MQIVVTPAVVVRVVDYGEADRVLTLLTRTAGKVSALARGARKSRRRFGAHGSLFTVGEAELRDRRGAELLSLVRLDADPFAPQLAAGPADMAVLCHASYLAELAREILPPRQAEPALYDLLIEALALLSSRAPRASTLRAFEVRVLRIAGLLPDFAESDVSDEERTVLEALGEGSLGDAWALELSTELNAACRGVLTHAVFAHLGRPLRSLEVLAQLNR
jgi:DNA repair protein RecO (recombination protein O)